MKKNEIIAKLNNIVVNGNSKDNGYHYELKINEWQNYGHSRTYFSIVETRQFTKHYATKKYGYFDNHEQEYVYTKTDGNIKYDFGGNNIINN